MKRTPMMQTKKFEPIREDKLFLNFNLQPGTTRHTMGKLNILLSPPFLEQGMLWHCSISHPYRYPTWDEIAHIRYELMPDDITVAMILPPKAEYVNLHNFCFHLHQILVADGFDALSHGGYK